MHKELITINWTFFWFSLFLYLGGRTWNGPPPGNGYCYAKASNASGPGSATMVSGGVTVGPPLPPDPPAVITLVSTTAVSTTESTYASWNIDSSCNRGAYVARSNVYARATCSYNHYAVRVDGKLCIGNTLAREGTDGVFHGIPRRSTQ